MNFLEGPTKLPSLTMFCNQTKFLEQVALNPTQVLLEGSLQTCMT